MLRFAYAAGVFALTCALASPASAQDAIAGQELAEDTCSRCHDVAPGGAFKQYPPSFQAIAIFRSAEDIRSRIIYPPVHTGMPQMGMIWAPGNVDNVVAYIVSLDTE